MEKTFTRQQKQLVSPKCLHQQQQLWCEPQCSTSTATATAAGATAWRQQRWQGYFSCLRRFDKLIPSSLKIRDHALLESITKYEHWTQTRQLILMGRWRRSSLEVCEQLCWAAVKAILILRLSPALIRLMLPEDPHEICIGRFCESLHRLCIQGVEQACIAPKEQRI